MGDRSKCNTLQHASPRWNTLWHTATTLKDTAAHYSTLQHIAAHCSTLQHTELHCITVHHTAPHYTTLHHTAPHCTTLHHNAPHCNTLQHTATHCNTLQHTATHCNTLQHTSSEVQHQSPPAKLERVKRILSPIASVAFATTDTVISETVPNVLLQGVVAVHCCRMVLQCHERRVSLIASVAFAKLWCPKPYRSLLHIKQIIFFEWPRSF